MAPGKDDGTLAPCPLCGRALIDGPSVNRHHCVPRGHGGDGWSVLHVICHKKTHSVLTDRELANGYATPESLRAHPRSPPSSAGSAAARRNTWTGTTARPAAAVEP